MENKKLNEQEIGLGRDSKTRSVWQENVKPVDTGDPQLFNPDHVYDVLIAGAGITGLTAALLLQKTGRKCVVAEAHTIGYGTTGGTTAHINTLLDTSYDQIEKDFGAEGARLVAQATREAIILIADLVGVYQMNCGFEYKKGYVFSENEKESEELKSILEASQRAGVAVGPAEELPAAGLPFDKAIVFGQQAQIHPLKYISKLAKEFIKQGGIILQNTPVLGTEKAGAYHIVKTGSMLQQAEQENGQQTGKPIRAEHVIYATHIPPGINILHLRCAPYRSYAVAAKLSDGAYPDGLLYDMKEPYHYIRSQEVNGVKYLIAGGEDHKTGHGNPEESYRQLEDYVRQHFKVASIDYRWSSQYFVPSDGLPYIGKLPGDDERVYTATGFSGNGITFGALAGKILCDLITGVKSPYAEIFSPGRIKPVAGFKDFVKENADVAYHFVADRLAGTSKAQFDDIPPDTGALVEHDGEKLAVYKDAAGTIHALSPVCTHAKCIVNWNAAEKSWDCPCHGARYSIDGEVLTGPATRRLESYKL